MQSTSQQIDYYVAVPSYRRADSIGGKTLALLRRHGVPPDRVYIFVANSSEEVAYRRQVGTSWPRIVVGVAGLWRQRNFITQYFKEGSHVVSLDDDIEDLYRLKGDPLNGGYKERLHAGALVDVIQDARLKMQALGVYMWALNTSDNPYYMKNSVSLRSGLCNGFFWGCITRHCEDLLLRDADVHEDVQRTARYVAKDGSVLRYRMMCAKTHCYTNKGGMQAYLTREQRKAEQNAAVDRLTAEFPLVVKPAPDSKLGLRFTHARMGVLQTYVSLSSIQFQRAVGCDKLHTLVGALWASLDARGVFCTGEIKFVSAQQAMIGLLGNGGQRYLAPCSEFLAALTRERLFVIWLPLSASSFLGVKESPEQSTLPGFLRSGATFLVNATSGHHEAESLQTYAGCKPPAPPSDFASYLAKLTCISEDVDEDDDVEARSVASSASTTASPRRAREKLAKLGDEPAPKAARLANTEKKRAERLEDACWVASQRSQLASLVKSGDSAPETCVDQSFDLQAWAIDDDFDGALRASLLPKSAPPDAGATDVSENTVHTAAHTTEGLFVGSHVKSLFCRSRIWGGGWGGQCTKPRVLHGELCQSHQKEIARQGYLTHGLIDGAIPPKKRLEFEKWQRKMRGEHRGSKGITSTVVADGTGGDFSADQWRCMERGASESARAYEYRTGHRVATAGTKMAGRKRLAGPCGDAAQNPPAVPRCAAPGDGPTSAEQKCEVQQSVIEVD